MQYLNCLIKQQEDHPRIIRIELNLVGYRVHFMPHVRVSQESLSLEHVQYNFRIQIVPRADCEHISHVTKLNMSILVITL
jgi:hypothetical protein